MAAERVGNMTRQELEHLVERIVEQKLRLRPWPVEQIERPVDELLDAMWEHIWTPPPGAKTSLEMLREDRER